MALVAAAFGGRDQWFDIRPFIVGQVTRISQFAAVVTSAVLRRPHRGAPLESGHHFESQTIQRIQNVFGRTLSKNLFLIGSLETGVTVYKQQIRAHNLVWALWEVFRNKTQLKRIAIVGGGIAGLTTAACLLGRLEKVQITILEKRTGLCPFQLGSDSQ